jgi:hypothetical protein
VKRRIIPSNLHRAIAKKTITRARKRRKPFKKMGFLLIIGDGRLTGDSPLITSDRSREPSKMRNIYSGVSNPPTVQRANWGKETRNKGANRAMALLQYFLANK